MKEKKLQIRISEKEIKMLRGQAKKIGLTISAYLRMLVHIHEKENKIKIENY